MFRQMEMELDFWREEGGVDEIVWSPLQDHAETGLCRRQDVLLARRESCESTAKHAKGECSSLPQTRGD
jgi:hypothetical protein